MPNIIRRKIFFSYALPILMSLLVLGVMSYQLFRHSYNVNQKEKLTFLAADYSRRIEAALQKKMAILERVETLDYRHNFRDPALTAHFARFSGFFPVLSYLNRQGEEEVKVVEGLKSNEFADYSARAWFAGAMARPNKIVIGRVADSPELGVPCLTLAVARFNYFGDEFGGVLKAEVPLRDLVADLPGVFFGYSGYLMLVDDRGVVLSHPDPHWLFNPLSGRWSLPGFGNGAAARKTGTTVDEIGGEKALVGWTDVAGLNWSVLAVLPYTEYIEPAAQMALIIFVTALFAMLLGLLMAHRIARPIVKNLVKVVAHADRVAAGELDLTLEIASGDEFDSLAISINRMTANIARSLESRDSLRNILQSIIDPLLLIGPDFRILDSNLAARQLLGLDQNELKGKPVTDFIADSTAAAETLIDEAQRLGILQNHETQLRLADNVQVPVLFSCSKTGPEIASEVALVAIIKDISDYKQAEEGRRQALIFTNTLLDQSPLGIRVFDGASGICVSVNPAAVKIAGGPVEALLSQNFRQLGSWKDAGLISVAEQVLADGKPTQFEAEMTTTFGNTLMIRYFLSRFMVEVLPHLMVIGQDITEEKRLAEKNRKIEAQMLQIQKLESLGVMAGGIAHDFNNILMAIMGNVDLALLHLSPGAAAESNLREIGKAAKKAAGLAGQMLAYTGRGKLEIQILDLNQFIEELLPMLEVTISKQAVLRFEPCEEIPVIEADASQINQVLMNMVINASEAIGEQDGVIEVRTGIMDCGEDYLWEFWGDDNLAAGTFVCCEVSDTGCGIDPEKISRIFDPFFSTKFAGRGLGMASVLGIVRGHNGAVKVTSEVGRGTTFRVLLPQSEKRLSAVEPLTPDTDWRGSGKILLVDDEAPIRAIGARMLEVLGFEALLASNGREALEIYRDQGREVLLVLMDLTMPQMGGEEACRELRLLDPEVKVILSSGYDEQEVADQTACEGALCFLQKPYQLAELRTVLRRVGKMSGG